MSSELVILRESGAERDGYPVLAPDSEADDVAAALSRGFGGDLLRLYGQLQHFLSGRGKAPEPAYLLLSDHEGGFARSGFFLGDVDKRGVGYVDLVKDQALAGEFGALDQIFPHELGHVMLRLLVGERPPGGANQVHALSVRTDRVLAFDEGFAEHLQVMAVDDPDAAAPTHALADDDARRQMMEREFARYRAELVSGSVAESGQARRFPHWYGWSEQCARYHAVKANRYAREPAVPVALLADDDPYRAYLIENGTLPGDDDRPRTPARAMAVEGFVSTFFLALVSSPAIQNSRESADFYDLFGVSQRQISPLENAYLKVFRAIQAGQVLTLDQFIASYCCCFPREAESVRTLLSDLLHGQELRQSEPIWLASPRFSTGTSLYDQYRAVPRLHTFDLNAASMTDLVTIPGVSPVLANRIMKALPVSDLSELETIPGVTEEIRKSMTAMAVAMTQANERPDVIEAGLMRELPRILAAYRQIVI